MKNSTLQYLVGIDLGTTHTVVAYVEATSAQPEIELFDIPQLIAPGEVAARPLLPSVRYHPADGELSEADTRFSFSADRAVLGGAARVLGAKSQGRLVTSAKSWLSHPSADHAAAILPWGSDDSVGKVSPLDASASYLAHIRSVWQHRFPDAPLGAQDIVITVPASFDESARSLTLEAAKLAGLHQVRLLEEPQAVCYDWLRRHAGTLQQELADVHLLLICDVGGGTTDLTLIKIEPGQPEPKLTRIGVGDHLMLGGDNIDLALAHIAESRLRNGEQKLSTADLSQLLEQCRLAKEQLLADDAPEQVTVALLGGGTRLIGGTRSTTLHRDEVRAMALDGFFPLSDLQELPDKKRSGVVEFGLPYAADPAVSKHVAAFLQLHRHAAQQALGTDSIVPDALLLNGGVFRSHPISQRIQQLLSHWAGKPPKLLDNCHPELAVAYGAVGYALARRQRRLRIGGGAARSYFLVIDSGNQQQGVCILPRGSEEGHELILHERQFALRVGQPVRFNLVSSSGDSDYQPGQLIDIDNELFHALPPLVVAFEGDQKAEVTVQLAVAYTEVGTLQIQCMAADDPAQRWNVEFQIRKKTDATRQDNPSLPTQFPQAEEKIQAVFGSKSKQVDPKAVKTLRADLEKLLGNRSEWPTPLCRALFSCLLAGSKYRRRSEQHERVWLSLAGFCLRPGYGYPLDDWHVEQLWKNHQDTIQFVNERQNWSEWWTLWRRVAGGLSADAQLKIFHDIAKFINPAAARQAGVAKQLSLRSYEDMVRLAAVLERLPIEQKTQLGTWLLNRLQKAGESEQSWWAVGRIGARVPFHGSSHNVVPADIVSPWLEQALTVDWKKSPHAGFAAMLIARKSGDRARDIHDALRERILDKLRLSKAPTTWVDLVNTVSQLNEQEEKQIFGEALPPGLKLVN